MINLLHNRKLVDFNLEQLSNLSKTNIGLETRIRCRNLTRIIYEKYETSFFLVNFFCTNCVI